MRHRLVLFVDKKEDRLDTFVVNVRRLKKAAKRLKTVKVNENFFFIFPALCRFPSKFKTIIYKQLCEYSTLLLLKTFAEFKKTNTLANCKDREKERGGRALS